MAWWARTSSATSAMNANGGVCTLSCHLSACGDGFLQAGEVCGHRGR